jgi:hypothetical protein
MDNGIPSPTMRLTLKVLDVTLAICQLEPGSEVEEWSDGTGIFSVMRTDDEVTIVCSEDLVPEGATCSKGWKCIRLVGQFDFTEVGIVSQLALPLAGANVPIFVMSTYNTDYVLVKNHDLQRASEALRMAGHHIL